MTLYFVTSHRGVKIKATKDMFQFRQEFSISERIGRCIGRAFKRLLLLKFSYRIVFNGPAVQTSERGVKVTVLQMAAHTVDFQVALY